MLLSDYVADVQELIHDTSQSIWPLNRVVSRINQARLYTSLDMKCVRQLVTNVQLIQNVEIYNIGIQPGTIPGFGSLPIGSFSTVLGNMSIAGANVTAAGTGYTASSTTIPVTFTAAPSGGITPTAVAVSNAAGQITSITMTGWGQGYLVAPTITVGGGGSGATVQPVTLSGVLYPLSLTFIFNGIRTMLRYLPFSLFQAYARILGVQFLSTPGVWTLVPETGQIYIQPLPNQNYIAELDCVFMAAPLNNQTDADWQIVEPWTRPAQFMAASLLLLKTRSYGEANTLAGIYERTIPKIVTGFGDVRVPNIYNRNFQRLVAR